MVEKSAGRELVVPGDLLGTADLKPGMGTFAEDGKVYAALLGIKNERSGYINIVPLSGRYIPRPGDSVIGMVTDRGPSHWLLEINSPYPAPLHVNEVPWRVDYGDTARYLDIGDILLLKVLLVDETKRVVLTMKEHGLRKLTGGQIVEISHSKVPRVIGRKGSMISLIKEFTRCRLFVGQNGRIWIDGDIDDVHNTISVIKRIEEEAQVIGLTESVKSMLEEMYGPSPVE
ncbi:MAG: RNA-binding protein [Thermoplasmata archaeon]|nr:RNA-binding protein [Thermoplasmata archaeon]